MPIHRFGRATEVKIDGLGPHFPGDLRGEGHSLWITAEQLYRNRGARGGYRALSQLGNMA